MDEVITVGDAASFRSGQATSFLDSPPSSSSLFFPNNLPLISAFLAFALAQFLKIFTTWYKEKRWDSKKMLDSGGMPSSHSATVSALAVAIGLQEGSGSPSFAIAVVLACILLNQIVCEFPPDHPLSSVRPLRELLGCGRWYFGMRCSVSDEKLELDHYKINIDYLFRLQLADNLVDIGSGSAGRYKSPKQMYNVFSRYSVVILGFIWRLDDYVFLLT
ncbi:hypothetical protein CUMW_230220 [Citrus unshiu]|uniref:Uncharacterized protein n=1 Tax=Citrus unshiu TaxID=55188 RepID=A0A2H5QHC6_CITUN|nr:hypothetical protein CUMW_230220 [Citrus unshiu]